MDWISAHVYQEYCIKTTFPLHFAKQELSNSLFLITEVCLPIFHDKMLDSMGVRRGGPFPWILKFAEEKVVFLVLSRKKQISPL